MMAGRVPPTSGSTTQRNTVFAETFYALDTILPDLGVPSGPDLERALAGHILAQTELIATYEKARR